MVHTARNRFASQVVTDLGGRRANVIGRVPGAKLRAVESHSAGATWRKAAMTMLALRTPYTHSLCGSRSIRSGH